MGLGFESRQTHDPKKILLTKAGFFFAFHLAKTENYYLPTKIFKLLLCFELAVCSSRKAIFHLSSPLEKIPKTDKVELVCVRICQSTKFICLVGL